MRSKQTRREGTQILPKYDFIVDGVNDELALILVSDEQVLVEIFELISEQSAHVSAPLTDFFANIANS